MISKCEQTFRKWRPVYTEPDGNCVFNAIILFLTASVLLDLVCKLRSFVVELFLNKRSYHRVLRDFCISSDEQFIDQ